MEPFNKEEFTIPRTPADLAMYFNEKHEHIATDKDLRKIARLRKDPFKTFIEELYPFSLFCSWKYGERDDVLCALVSGTPGRDATITDLNTHSVHSIEITWPIDGLYYQKRAKQLNERGCTETIIYDYDDISLHQVAITPCIRNCEEKGNQRLSRTRWLKHYFCF